MVKSGIGLVLAACVFLPACGGDDDEPAPNGHEDEIEIAGTWTSNFGGTETIDHHSWSAESSAGTFAQEIVEFSNDDNAAVLKADDDTFGRNVWTEPSGGAFFYCTVAYGKASAQAAIDESDVADDTDPETTGCAGFSWTKLTSE
jgi:hypothetical protein